MILQAALILNILFVLPVFPKSPPIFPYAEALETAIEAAREGGNVLLQYWNKRVDLEVKMKGSTPVTIADLQSSAVICKKLLMSFPEYGLLTEETLNEEWAEKAQSRWRSAEWTWIVDPLDGTKSFLSGKKEIGILIALLHFGCPVLGVNYYPMMQTLYLGVKGYGAYKQVKKRGLQQIHTDKTFKIIRPVVSSKKSAFLHSFYTKLLGIPLSKKILRKDFRSVGSCGLRLCLIAEGKCNIYASNGESGYIWDYASGSVILTEAGGFISDLKGEPLNFLSESLKFKAGTLSCGSKELFKKAIKISGSGSSR